MTTFEPGLVHTPVTPFKLDQSVDYDTYARILEWHIRNGAETLALPMPEGEDMSLTDAEQRELLTFAMKHVKGRVPVIAHVSDAGTAITVERAQFAEQAGARAIASHPPYFWHPRPAMVIDHLMQVGRAIKLPLFIINPPVETAGTSLTTEMVLELVEKLPNLAGVVDYSLDFVFMEEIMCLGRQIKPEFRLLAGGDFPVSSGTLGGTGVFSTLSSIAPRLARGIFELSRQEQYNEARDPQEKIAELNHVIRNAGESGLRDGLAGLKTAMALMGRPCGAPRPPVRALGEVERGRFNEALARLACLEDEPRGW
jgi:dihydrodipicolinate synthase/N-acetylneuraminate lyase